MYASWRCSLQKNYFHIYSGSSIEKAQNIFNDCATNEQHKAPDSGTF